MSSVNELSWRSWISFGSDTYVPLPWVRSSRPSTTSSAIACRTVVRDTANRSARSRSVGSSVPTAAPSISRSSSPFSW